MILNFTKNKRSDSMIGIIKKYILVCNAIVSKIWDPCNKKEKEKKIRDPSFVFFLNRVERLW